MEAQIILPIRSHDHGSKDQSRNTIDDIPRGYKYKRALHITAYYTSAFQGRQAHTFKESVHFKASEDDITALHSGVVIVAALFIISYTRSFSQQTTQSGCLLAVALFGRLC